MTARVSGRFRNSEVKKKISAGGSRRPEIFLPSKSYSRISSSGRSGSKGGRIGMMRKLSPRGERQLTCPHISANSQRSNCTPMANLSFSSSMSLIMDHPRHNNRELPYQSFGGGNRRLANGFLFFFRVGFPASVLVPPTH